MVQENVLLYVITLALMVLVPLEKEAVYIVISKCHCYGCASDVTGDYHFYEMP